jgi:hypothetical protein
MRPIKELLVLLRDDLPWLFTQRGAMGLCTATWLLGWYEKVTSDEFNSLHAYVVNHSPIRKSGAEYWFPMGELAPRIEFLNKLIDELTNKENGI